MTLRAETQNFLRELERFSDRTLNFRDEVGLLIEVADQKGKMGMFNDAIFLAKFITKSMGVMKRIGVDGEGYDKLSAEFQSNIQKVSTLLREILEVASEGERRNMSPFFLSLTQESLEHLVLLLSDLAIVKNWVLDGKQIPGACRLMEKPTDQIKHGVDVVVELKRIITSGALVFLLLMLAVLLDGPVSILAWMLLAVAFLCLAYVVIASRRLLILFRSQDHKAEPHD